MRGNKKKKRECEKEIKGERERIWEKREYENESEKNMRIREKICEKEREDENKRENMRKGERIWEKEI